MRLTRKNYYGAKANIEYMSASQFKDFQRCEAAALDKILSGDRQEPTTAMLVGSYVDAFFSGELDEFKTNHPEVFTKQGQLKSEFKQAEVIIQRFQSQPEMMKYLSGRHQRIFTGEIAGVPFKCRVDSYLPKKAIVDQKVMRSFEDKYDPEKGSVLWYEYWGYDIQGAIYQEIVRQKTGLTLPFILDAATKEDEPDLALIEISQTSLKAALQKVERDAPRYDAIKKGIIPPTRCEKCPYCRRTKVVTLINSEDLLYA